VTALNNVFVVRKTIDFGQNPVNDDGVVQLFDLPAGAAVLDYAVRVDTEEGGVLTADLGIYNYATGAEIDADCFLDGIDLNDDSEIYAGGISAVMATATATQANGAGVVTAGEHTYNEGPPITVTEAAGTSVVTPGAITVTPGEIAVRQIGGVVPVDATVCLTMRDAADTAVVTVSMLIVKMFE